MTELVVERVSYVIILVLSLSVHEWAHAWSAFRLGDDTAARMGRLTLNPLSHIDPIGTIALPLLGIPFGWAKPVPVNPARFRRDVHMGTGMMLTASAGPISNLILALLCAVGLGVLMRLGVVPYSVRSSPVGVLLSLGLLLNVSLAVFNLLPIPPLDGSRIVERFVPYRLRHQWDRFTTFAPLLLLAVVLFGGSLIAGPTEWLRGLLRQLVRWLAF